MQNRKEKQISKQKQRKEQRVFKVIVASWARSQLYNSPSCRLASILGAHLVACFVTHHIRLVDVCALLSSQDCFRIFSITVCVDAKA